MAKKTMNLKRKTYPHLVRQWNIPGIQWRIKLLEKEQGLFQVKMQPFHPTGGLSSQHWYNLLGSQTFETESGAAWAILNRLDGGNL